MEPAAGHLQQTPHCLEHWTDARGYQMPCGYLVAGVGVLLFNSHLVAVVFASPATRCGWTMWPLESVCLVWDPGGHFSCGTRGR